MKRCSFLLSFMLLAFGFLAESTRGQGAGKQYSLHRVCRDLTNRLDIVFIGASLTASSPISWTGKFTKLIKERYENVVTHNLAKGGTHSWYFSFCFNWTLPRDASNTLFFVEFAVNDFYQLANVPIEQKQLMFDFFFYKLESIAPVTAIIYVGLQDERGDSALAWQLEILERRNIPVILPMDLERMAFLPDGMHQTPASAQLLGERVFQGFQAICKQADPQKLSPIHRHPLAPFRQTNCQSLLSDSLRVLDMNEFEMKTFPKPDRQDLKRALVGHTPGASMRVAIEGSRVWMMFYRDLETGNARVFIESLPSCVPRKLSCSRPLVEGNLSRWNMMQGGYPDEIFSIDRMQLGRHYVKGKGTVPDFIPGYSIVEITDSSCAKTDRNLLVVHIQLDEATEKCNRTGLQVVAFLTAV